MSGDHDSGYKLLFSHPEMVRDLLCDWVPGEWVAEADFSTLERQNGSYVAENMKQRHADMVWRLKLRERWIWVYLILEFQSEPDEWMALRMVVYVGLLAQDLVKQGELAEGKLPPILPLVLYNGRPVWAASREVAELFAPAPPWLEAYRPHLAYHLIDEARLKHHPTASVRNAVEALFRLEHHASPPDIVKIIEAVDGLLHDPAAADLRRRFNIWVKRWVLRELRVRADSTTIETIKHIHDILGAHRMLAERFDDWLNKGIQQGRQEGRMEGRMEGLDEGILKGEAKLLARQIERRFGPMPQHIAERLAGASEADLEAWGEAVLTAPTLDAVFGDNRH